MACAFHRVARSWVVPVALLIASSVNSQPITTAYFRLTLPPGWAEVVASLPDQFVFRNASENRQLTISAFDSKSLIDDATFDRIVEIRLKAERKALQSSDQVEVGAVERSAEVRRVFFSVIANTRPRRYATGAIIATPHRIVTFYVETLGGTRDTHADASRAILESARVR